MESNSISRQVKIVSCIGAGTIYIVGGVLLYAVFPAGILVAALLPVAVTGFLLGWRAGLVACILAFPVHTALLNYMGEAGWDAVFLVGGAPGVTLIVLAGIASGWAGKLYDRLRTEMIRREEAERLREAGAAVIESLPRDEAIARILEQLQRVVAYDSASVQLLRNGHLEIVAGRGWAEPEEDVVGLRFPIPGDNPNTVVIQKERPHITP